MNSEEDLDLAKRLAYVRKEHNCTRVRLSEEIGVPYGTIAKYETGEREAGHRYLIKLARAFNVTTDYILGLSEIKRPQEDQSHEEQSAVDYNKIAEIVQALGYIRPSEDLTDIDLKFLLGLGEMLQAWSMSRNERGQG